MSLDHTIHQLAVISGIDEHTSIENKEALLVAMEAIPSRKDCEGMDYEKIVNKSLEKILDKEFEKPTKPVTITRENRQQSIEITVPADMENQSVKWSIKQENGERSKGSVKVLDMEIAKDDNGNTKSRVINGVKYEKRILKKPEGVEFGYHKLTIETPDGKSQSSDLIHCPQKCYDPIDIKNGGKRWGVPVQLYEQKSQENQGLGDLSDLDEIAYVTAKTGASILGVNPLHAMFPDKPEEASPYSPSSRTYFNHMYLDVTAIPDFEKSPKANEIYDSENYTEKRRKVQRASMVDYTSVMELKQPIMDACFESFQKNNLQGALSKRGKDFKDYCEEGGKRMEDFAVFQALSEKFNSKEWLKDNPRPQNWKDWPEEYKDIKSPAVESFRKENKDRVEFYQYMQWETNRQMEHVQETCQKYGMDVGLYTDIAVGGSPDGYEGWGCKDLYMHAAAGAPADVLSPNGQNWQVLGFKPEALKDEGYKPFVDMLKNNMKNAGCTRLDHVLQLARLYMIPEGKSAKEGAFVYYPVDDLMAITALESHRNKAMTIGEDLGQLPPGFREKMEDHGILSYRVLPFEREWGFQNGNSDGSANAIRHSNEYPVYSTAAPSTHDTAPLASQWHARHVHHNDFLGYYETEAQKNLEFEQYATQRAGLNHVLAEEGCWKRVGGKPVENPREDTQSVPEKFEQAVADFLGRSNSAIMLMPFSDIFRTNYMGNIPGTRQLDASISKDAQKDLEPKGASKIPFYNWRPKMHYSVHEIETSPTYQDVANILTGYRPSSKWNERQKENFEDYKRPGKTEERNNPNRIHELYNSLKAKGMFKKEAYDIIAAKFKKRHKDREEKKYETQQKRFEEKRKSIDEWKQKKSVKVKVETIAKKKALAR
jgi:4-alpha-glucanotransferase